jgi:iron complex outermembrane receptor protein
LEGNKAENAPENVANFLISYIFQNQLKGLGLGFSGNYVDKTYRLANNFIYSPQYTLYNSTVFYNQEKWRIGAKFNNMTNKKYWDSQWNAQKPSNFAIDLTVRF